MNTAAEYYLLTWFGSIVVFNRDTGKFGQRKREELTTHDARVICAVADVPTPASNAGPAPSSARLALEGCPDEIFGPYTLEDAGRPGVVFIRDGDLALATHPSGTVSWAQGHSSWEQFLLIDFESYLALVEIASSRWVIRSRRSLLGPERIAFVEGFQLSMGGDRYQLPETLPIRIAQQPRRSVRLFRDLWKVEEYVLFDPVLYYVCFGPELFDALLLSLESSIHPAGFDGRIVVMTDRSTQELARHVPRSIRHRVKAVNIQDGDFVQQCLSRYFIGAVASVAQAQPIIYLDTDVLMDVPIEPFLVDLLLSDRIEGGAEHDSPIASKDSMGASLFREDGTPAPASAGFNAGLLGFPSIPIVERDIRLIIDTVRRHAQASGGVRTMSHYDQAIANYVTSKLDIIGYGCFHGRMRWGVGGGLFGGDEPCGFVHFWGYPHDRRPAVMRAYLDRLPAQPATDA